jgi:hypothetical protein
MPPTAARVATPALALALCLVANGAAGQEEWGACSDVCSWETDCSWGCLDGTAFSTCGDYGVCGSPPPPPPSCTADSCEASACGVHPSDGDCDGVPEQLEHDLAHRFFPNLLLQHQVPDVDQAYLKLGRATPYTVQPLLPPRHRCNEASECLEIRYAIAFKNDCGDYLPWEGTAHCDNSTSFPNKGHVGDSEFYVALVQRTTSWSQAQGNASSWVLIRDFTSAHWGDTGDSSVIGAYGDQPPWCWGWGAAQCQQYPSQCLWTPEACQGFPTDPYASSCRFYTSYGVCESFEGCYWTGGCTPRAWIIRYSASALAGPATIFASEGKHALYHTDAECDNGGYDIPLLPDDPADECPRSSYPASHNLRTHKGSLLQNVGWVSSGTDGQNSNCVSRDTSFQHPNWCSPYETWSGARFADSTDYRR